MKARGESGKVSNVHRLTETHEIKHNRAVQLACDNDLELSLKLTRSLIDEGFFHAHSLAGAIYERMEQYEKAYSHYESAAELAHSMVGWLGIARLCYFGKGVEKDYEYVFRVYKEIIEKEDDMRCWFMHGEMYRLGRGVEKDLGKAKECFRIAEDKGYVFATTNLAFIDWEENRYVRSIFKRIKAGWRTFIIGIKSGNDDVRISYPPP